MESLNGNGKRSGPLVKKMPWEIEKKKSSSTKSSDETEDHGQKKPSLALLKAKQCNQNSAPAAVSQQKKKPVSAKSSQPQQTPILEKENYDQEPKHLGNLAAGLPDEPADVEEGERVECPDCGRMFNSNRLEVHLKICKKVFQMKRKPFDSTKARNDPEALKIMKQQSSKNPEQSKKPEQRKPKWKRDHEQFVAAMRAAKGGESQPLEPAEQDDSLLSCPHCGRKFNESAHQRHVKICQQVFKNKPRNQAQQPTQNTNKQPAKITIAPQKSSTLASPKAPKPIQQTTSTTPAPSKVSGRVSQVQETVPCPHCNRKFEKHAAERHVEICQKVVNKPKPTKQAVAPIKKKA